MSGCDVQDQLTSALQVRMGHFWRNRRQYVFLHIKKTLFWTANNTVRQIYRSVFCTSSLEFNGSGVSENCSLFTSFIGNTIKSQLYLVKILEMSFLFYNSNKSDKTAVVCRLSTSTVSSSSSPQRLLPVAPLQLWLSCGQRTDNQRVAS